MKAILDFGFWIEDGVARLRACFGFSIPDLGFLDPISFFRIWQ